MRPFFNSLKAYPKKLFTVFLWGASLLPLAVFGYMGGFTRYLADDYSNAGMVRQLGFWQVQAYWYTSWHGDYAFAFLISLVEMAGPMFASYLPALNIIFWGLVLFWFLYRFSLAFNLRVSRLLIALLVNIVLFATIKTFPGYSQIIFWQIVIIRYLLPMELSLLCASLLLRRFHGQAQAPLKLSDYIFWGVVAFIVGGFAESWVIMQITMSALGLIAWQFLSKKSRRSDVATLLAVIFVASWLSLIVIAKSPGNMHRDTIMAELSFGLLYHSIFSAFFDVPRYLMEWLKGNTALVGLLSVAGLVVGLFSGGMEQKKIPLRAMLALFLGAYITMWAGFVPQYAVMGIRPAERVIIMPMTLFITFFVLVFVASGQKLADFSLESFQTAMRRAMLLLLALVIFWLPVRSALTYVRLVPTLRTYAQLWDQRDQKLREAAADGEGDVIVKSLKRNPALHDIQTTFWIEGDLQEDPNNWINQAASIYYGLNSITLR